MKIEKLPSGSYRIRKMYKGKTYTVVTDYKPTQKEAMQLMAAELDKVKTSFNHMTFSEAAKKYIESKENVLSPRTIKEYTETPKRLSDHFTSMLISDITQIDIQKEINVLSKDKSPKTVRNYHGFISAVLGTFKPELNISTTLPKKTKNKPYIPSDSDIKKILKYANGTKYEIPIILACYGLRRSEICALALNDIDGNIIHINKAKVLDVNKNWIIKSTKTTSSTRDIILPDNIIKMIFDNGEVYNGHPNNITDFLSEAQKKLNITHFSIHKLRHYFASKLSAMNIPEEDILEMGGWETDYVMKNVYRHTMEGENKKSQKKASDKLAKAIFS